MVGPKYNLQNSDLYVLIKRLMISLTAILHFLTS